VKEIKPCKSWHEHVSNDDVRVAGFDEIPCFYSVRSQKHIKTPGSQTDSQKFPHIRIVIRKQNFNGLACHRLAQWASESFAKTTMFNPISQLALHRRKKQKKVRIKIPFATSLSLSGIRHMFQYYIFVLTLQ
jgi:hypothetical protein